MASKGWGGPFFLQPLFCGLLDAEAVDPTLDLLHLLQYLLLVLLRNLLRHSFFLWAQMK